MDTSQYVTRAELESILDERFDKFYIRIEKMVGQVVGEIVSEALQLISERFDRLEARMDCMADDHHHLKSTVTRHSIEISSLKRKIN